MKVLLLLLLDISLVVNVVYLQVGSTVAFVLQSPSSSSSSYSSSLSPSILTITTTTIARTRTRARARPTRARSNDVRLFSLVEDRRTVATSSTSTTPAAPVAATPVAATPVASPAVVAATTSQIAPKSNSPANVGISAVNRGMVHVNVDSSSSSRATTTTCSTPQSVRAVAATAPPVPDVGGVVVRPWTPMPVVTTATSERPIEMLIQGGSLKTFPFTHPNMERIRLTLKTKGRPLHAHVELWQGPDNTPQTMQVYLESGSISPFHCILASPGGYNSVAVRNIAGLEFPLVTVVGQDSTPVNLLASETTMTLPPRKVQGGAVYTVPFDSSVARVKILLQTDGRPLKAQIELLQGPNNSKQVIHVYTEDGLERPFFAILEAPGSGNVVRIVNTATIEYPLLAFVEPYDNTAAILTTATTITNEKL